MSYDDDMDDDSVGYGKPPKHSQFKKGKSGNPKGRPPKKILHEVVIDTLNEEVILNMGGKEVTMTKKEAMIQQLVNQSMKGKSEATRNMIHLIRWLREMPPI